MIVLRSKEIAMQIAHSKGDETKILIFSQNPEALKAYTEEQREEDEKRMQNIFQSQQQQQIKQERR